MICLETIGYCSEQKGSQRLSFMRLLLPRQGDFLALVGNTRSKELLRETHRLFSLHPNLPCKSLTLPTNFPGAWSSDHWSFWKEGYPAVWSPIPRPCATPTTIRPRIHRRKLATIF